MTKEELIEAVSAAQRAVRTATGGIIIREEHHLSKDIQDLIAHEKGKLPDKFKDYVRTEAWAWTQKGDAFRLEKRDIDKKGKLTVPPRYQITMYDGKAEYVYDAVRGSKGYITSGVRNGQPSGALTPLSFGYRYKFTPLDSLLNKWKMTAPSTKVDPVYGEIVTVQTHTENGSRLDVEFLPSEAYLATSIIGSGERYGNVFRQVYRVTKIGRTKEGVPLALEAVEEWTQERGNRILESTKRSYSFRNVKFNVPVADLKLNAAPGALFSDIQTYEQVRLEPSGKFTHVGYLRVAKMDQRVAGGGILIPALAAGALIVVAFIFYKLIRRSRAV